MVMKIRPAVRTFVALLAGSMLAAPSALAGQAAGAADTEEEIERIRPGQDTVIYLNPRDPSFNVWQQLRDFSEDNRPPGPINVQRYEGNVPWVGIPTFFHLPVALTPEDLRVGNVEVAIFGAELIGDMRARSWGPMEMRNPHRSEVYHNWGAFSDAGAGRRPHLVALQELTDCRLRRCADRSRLSIERSIPEIQ